MQPGTPHPLITKRAANDLTCCLGPAIGPVVNHHCHARRVPMPAAFEPCCRFCLENGLLLDAPAAATSKFYLLGSIERERPAQCLVVPYRHVLSPFDLDAEEWSELGGALRAAKVALNHFAPSGWTIGWNVGASGGQEIMHAHLHVVARFDDEVSAGRGIHACFEIHRRGGSRKGALSPASRRRCGLRQRDISVGEVEVEGLSKGRDCRALRSTKNSSGIIAELGRGTFLSFSELAVCSAYLIMLIRIDCSTGADASGSH